MGMKRFLPLALLVACSSSPEQKPSPAAPVKPAPATRTTTRPAPSTPPPALAAATAVVVPGRRIGPYALGMSREEVVAVRGASSESTTSVIIIGPYEIVLDEADPVHTIVRRLASNIDGTPLTEPLELGSVTIDPSTTFDDLLRIVPGCGEVEYAEGGNTARCADQLQVQAAGPVGLVRIAVATSR